MSALPPLPMGPAYPIDAFYADEHDAIRAVYEWAQAPMAMIAMSFLSTMGLACQALWDVQLPYGSLSPLSLYMLIVADSGERKSAVDGKVAGQFHDLDETLEEQYRLDLISYKSAMNIWRREGRRLDRELARAASEESRSQAVKEILDHGRTEPVAPRSRKIMLENVSTTAIFEALDGDGESIAFHSAEGETVLEGGAMDTPGVLNKAWDGETPLNLDRARGRSLRVRRPRVAIYIAVQKAILQRKLGRRGDVTRGSGHMSRYLVADPDSTQGYRLMFDFRDPSSDLLTFRARIAHLQSEYSERLRNAGQKRKILVFSEEAKRAWLKRNDEIEMLIRPGQDWSEIKDFASKSLQITARVAAILHAFKGLEGEISLETFNRAWMIVQWHANEFKRLFFVETTEQKFTSDLNAFTQYLHHRIFLEGYGHVLKTAVQARRPRREEGNTPLDAMLEWMMSHNQVQIAHVEFWGGQTQWFPERTKKSKQVIVLNDHFFASLGGIRRAGNPGLLRW
jgi:hypothetical protein